MIHYFHSFWERNPALFFGLCLFLGTAASFQPCWPLFLSFCVLCSSCKRKALPWAMVCFLGAFFTASYRCPKVILPREKMTGTAIFHIEEVKEQSSPFNKSLLYKGTLKSFETGEKTYCDLPCHIYLPLF